MVKKECSADGCGRPMRALGLCASHWRMQHAGEPLRPINSYRVIPPPSKDTKVCAVCMRVRNLDKFYRRTNGKPVSACKTCCIAIAGERQRRRNHNLPPLTQQQIIDLLGLSES